ncbi:MAG: SBBP repeat-containing protein [Bryobacteraceae bacterium]
MKVFSVILLVLAAFAQGAPRTDAVNLGEQPVWFEENRGQVDTRARYFARGRGYHVYLNSSEAILALHGEKPAVLTMKLDGARREASIEGGGMNADRSSYFHGNDPKKWVTGVAHHSSVRVRGAWEGVDVRYYENGRRLLEHDFVVAAGADASRIRMRFEGAGAVRVEKDGALTIETAAGPVRWEKPEAYQTVDGARRDVESAYRVGKDGAVDFVLGEYDRGAELVIDPELVYARFVGGSGQDQITDMVYRPGADELLIVGETSSIDIPILNAFDDRIEVAYFQAEAFLLRTTPTGPRHFTYIGGRGWDTAAGVAVDSAGSAYLCGTTGSTDFPAQGGVFPSSAADGYRVYILKLPADGRTLAYSSLIGGGTSYQQARAIAIDAQGAAYVTGLTSSSNFPVTAGAFRPANSNFLSDAFVLKLNAQGTALVYASYLGGFQDDEGNGIAVNASGEAFVVGTTYSESLATAGALRSTVSLKEAFVARINAGGTALVYFTYFGGSGDDTGKAVAVDGNLAIIGGSTTSTDLAVVNATQPVPGGARDGYVAVLNSSGSAATFATYLGGYPDDEVLDIAAASVSSFVAVGRTESGDFPAVDRLQRAGGYGEPDGFVTWFRAAPGYSVPFSTNLGAPGVESEEITAVTVDPGDPANRIYVGGWTRSSGFPADRRPAVAREIAGGNTDPLVTPPQSDGFYARLTTSTGACAPEMWLEPSSNGTDAVVPRSDRVEARRLFLKVRAAHNCAWSITVPPPWLSSSATTGTGVATMVLEAQDNGTLSTRTASLAVSPGGASVTVTQAGACFLSVSPSLVTIPKTGAAVSLTLTADAGCPWDIGPLPLPNWLTVAQTSGLPRKGSAKFSISAAPLAREGSRSIFLAFRNDTGPRVVVTQEGCTYSLGVLPVLPFGGATNPMTITTDPGCPWSIRDLPQWLTASPASGTGSGTVQLTAAPNPDESRFHDGSVGLVSFRVRQASQACSVLSGPADFAVSHRGGTVRIPVTAGPGCFWLVGGDNIGASGRGASVASLELTPNFSTVPRHFDCTVRDPNIDQVLHSFSIDQAGLPPAVPSPMAPRYPGSVINQFRFADSNGAADISVLNILIADALDGRNACYLAFVPGASKLFVVNDQGDALVQPPMMFSTSGISGFTANSQCVVGPTANLSMAGEGIEMTLGIAASTTFTGSKVLYAAARDGAGNNSGWVPMSIWRGSAKPPTNAPAATFSEPPRGIGRTDRFVLKATDPNGAVDIQSVSFLLNGAIDGRHACYLGYHRPSNSLQLVNDNGNGVKGTMVLDGGPGVVENSQCRVLAAGSSASASGNEITLTLNVEFKAAFAGDKVLYLGIQDQVSTSGWTPMSTYTVIP